MLTPNQISELLQIIDKNQAIAIGRELGLSFLTEQDLETLFRFGVDVNSLYSPANDSIFTSFHLGMLAESLYAARINQLSYKQLRDYISKGKYVPITTRDQIIIDSIKAQAFNDVRTLGGRIFRDVNQILIDNTLREQQRFLRDEIAASLLDKKITRKAANDISEKTGDWSRDFDRIITYVSTQAFEEGKAAMIVKNYDDQDPLVYKRVFENACKHCVRLYLTDGPGSAPRIFKLSQLKANGTNIGRKVVDWLPTLGPVHPYCRCMLNHYKPNSKWNTDKKVFETPTVSEFKRKPIRVWIGGKEEFV